MGKIDTPEIIMKKTLSVGDEVIFIGPTHRYSAGGLKTGDVGTIIKKERRTASQVGELPSEMVIVLFWDAEKPMVVDMSRLKWKT